MKIIRDRLDALRKLSDIKDTCNKLSIGVKESAVRQGLVDVDLNKEKNSGRYGLAVHYLLGSKDHQTQRSADNRDCEIKTYDVDSKSLISWRAFSDADLNGTFEESSQFQACERTIFVGLEKIPGTDDKKIVELTSLDLANKNGLYKEIKASWESARDLCISNRNHAVNNAPYVSPLFTGVVLQPINSQVKNSNGCLVYDKKGAKYNHHPLCRMKKSYVKIIENIEILQGHSDLFEF